MRMRGSGPMGTFLLTALVLLIVLPSCAVLNKDLLQTGTSDVYLGDLTSSPESYKGKLFILGGTILHTIPAENGTLIDVLYVPTNALGYLKLTRPGGRFIAFYPQKNGEIDNVHQYNNIQITLAAVFMGAQTGTDGEKIYKVPVFRIEQIYLWPTDSYYTINYLIIGCPGPYRGPYWGPYFEDQVHWPHLYPLCEGGVHWPPPMQLFHAPSQWGSAPHI